MKSVQQVRINKKIKLQRDLSSCKVLETIRNQVLSKRKEKAIEKEQKNLEGLKDIIKKNQELFRTWNMAKSLVETNKYSDMNYRT